jgi:hypothetical protein
MQLFGIHRHTYAESGSAQTPLVLHQELGIAHFVLRAWIWVLVYYLVLPGTLPVIQMRIQVAALTQAGLYIGNKLYDILSTLQDISTMAASFRTIIFAWFQHQPIQLHGIIVVHDAFEEAQGLAVEVGSY